MQVSTAILKVSVVANVNHHLALLEEFSSHFRLLFAYYFVDDSLLKLIGAMYSAAVCRYFWKKNYRYH